MVICRANGTNQGAQCRLRASAREGIAVMDRAELEYYRDVIVMFKAT